MFDFGKERGLELALASETSQSKSLSNLESPDLKDSPRRYAVQLNGWKENADGESRERSPDLRMLYCPLLPNEVQPDFNPAVSVSSNHLGRILKAGSFFTRDPI